MIGNILCGICVTGIEWMCCGDKIRSKFKNSSTSGFTISENSLNTSSKLEIIMKGFELVNAGISHPEC